MAKKKDEVISDRESEVKSKAQKDLDRLLLISELSAIKTESDDTVEDEEDKDTE
jgi:hypothetical protein